MAGTRRHLLFIGAAVVIFSGALLISGCDTPEVPFDMQVMMIEGAPFSQFVGRDAEIREAKGLCEIVKFY